MAKKTFKIGEYANGGIIQAIVKDDTLTIINKEWDYSQGTRRGSDQSNAKEIDRRTFNSKTNGAYRLALDYLCGITTSYYADKILDWAKEKGCKFENRFFGW